MHVERKEVDDWVSACRNLEVAGSRGRGSGVASWGERLTRISAETTDVKPAAVLVVVKCKSANITWN